MQVLICVLMVKLSHLNGGFSIAMFDKQRVTNIFCRLLDMITNDKGSYTTAILLWR